MTVKKHDITQCSPNNIVFFEKSTNVNIFLQYTIVYTSAKQIIYIVNRKRLPTYSIWAHVTAYNYIAY